MQKSVTNNDVYFKIMGARFTSEQAAKFQIVEHHRPTKSDINHKPQVEAAQQQIQCPRSVRVRGTRGRSKEPNKTEQAYIVHLKGRKMAGEIKDFWFESVKFRLADRTWFEIDFMVLTMAGEMEMHEVKARWKGKDGATSVHFEEDSKIKLKVAAEIYPFRFIVASYFKGNFSFEEV